MAEEIVAIYGLFEMQLGVKVELNNIVNRCVRRQYLVGDTMLGEMKKRTPKKTGKLIDSAGIDQYYRNGEEVVVLHYGNANVTYATYVHEILRNRHPVGQAKFMESVVQEYAPHVAGLIAGGS